MEQQEEVRVPWGSGIAGYVAESGDPVNISDAYQVRTVCTYQTIIKIIYHLFRCFYRCLSRTKKKRKKSLRFSEWNCFRKVAIAFKHF